MSAIFDGTSSFSEELIALYNHDDLKKRNSLGVKISDNLIKEMKKTDLKSRIIISMKKPTQPDLKKCALVTKHQRIYFGRESKDVYFSIS